MPQTKFQGVIFGLIMSFSMAYGMEVYNQCILHQYQSMPGGFSNMTNIVFLDALKETCFIAIFVFFFSNLYGNRLGQKLAHRFVKPKEDNFMFVTIIISCCTVFVMCPTMSCLATILFNYVLGNSPYSDFFAIWIGTILKNYPMALIFNLFGAGPFTRFVFRKIFLH